MIIIKPNSKRFSQQDLNELEKKVCASFPEEYVNFLRKYNGAKLRII
ncbi:SMI1/KNR4 family protein (plasmid) [Bacillus megaterium]|nr:SMI1/KNR4 family protein [Priestia megaterium]